MKVKFIKDIIINTVASGLSVVALQFLILPLIAAKLSEDNFGLLLTIVSLLSITGATFGNVLNNVRVISDENYDDQELDWNLNSLFKYTGIISTVLTIVLSLIMFKNIVLIDFILISLLSILLLTSRFYIVQFRIKLNFVQILVNNIILIIGYLVGYLIFIITGYWQFSYIIANVFSILHIFIMGKPRLKSKKTKIFSELYLKYITLLASGLLLSMTSYIDKLLIFPLLGGYAVSIYYTSTLLGKILNLIVSPVSNVLLSYLKKDIAFIKKRFILLLLSSLVVGVIFYFLITIAGKIIIDLLYPQFYDDAVIYIPITTLTALLVSVSAFINPFLLKFNNIKWQVIIELVYLFFYMLLSLSLLHFQGLSGFVLGICLSSGIKLIIQVTIFLSNAQIRESSAKVL